MLSQHINLLTSLFLLPNPIIASVCRNLTNVRWGSDGPYGFSNTNLVPLENVNCPPNTTVPSSALPKCEVPRSTYDIVVPRLINVTNLSLEDENAVFERARLSYWMSGSQRDNESAWDDEWIPLPRRVDTTRNGREGDSDLFFETSAAYNYTLFFVSFDRWVFGTLGGCDNETLNGMGISVRAPYEMRDENNVTIVAGQLLGSATNTTKSAESEENTSAGSIRNMFSGGLYAVVGFVGFMIYL